MKMYSFGICSTFVLLVVVTCASSEKVNFSNKKEAKLQSTSKDDKDDVTSKRFEDENGLRAASTCFNCECQCDSYAWKDTKNHYIGNCQR